MRGARYLAKRKQDLRDREQVVIQHYQADDSFEIKPGIRKRKGVKSCKK